MRGAAEHNLRTRRRAPAEARADRLHRAVGLGQVVARLRHDLRRGPAPLRRVALELRAPVPRPDGEAEVRPHPRPLAHDLDRAEGGEQQPALDGRHDHRGVRLPARALGAHRPPALPRAAGAPVERLSAEEIVDRLLALPPGTRFLLLARLVDNRKGEYQRAAARGGARGLRALPHRRRGGGGRRAAGARQEAQAHDRRRRRPARRARERQARARARHRLGRDRAARRARAGCCVQIVGGEERLYSEELWCHRCDHGFPELSPQSFSFNSPLGMCPDCNGLGTKPEMDPALVVPDPSKSVRERRDRALGEGDGALAALDGLAAQQDRARSSASTSTARGRELPRAPPRPPAPRLARARRSRSR